MTTKIPRLLLTGALLAPSTLFALGLGEIHLNSALNQPFDADIELISPGSEELASLKVGLASSDAFSRYGVDRMPLLSDFRFRVTRGADGRSVLKVTSRNAVTEPFVTFIVEAGWSRGKLLREYTVLLDPPVYMPGGGETAAPVATPRAGAQPEGAIQRPRETAPRPAATPAAARTAPAAFTGGTYTVQRNDTLWRIASRIRPGSSRVVNQTMMAIYHANPQAFDGNINLLRAGAVLQIPDAQTIEQLSQAEASREVSDQYAAWRGGAESTEGARLRLVAPDDSATPTRETTPQPRPGSGTADDSAMRARVDRLESELAEARRLLELRNAELAEMQQRLREAGEAAVEPADVPPPAVEAETPVPAEEPVAVEPPQPTPAAEPAAEPARPPAPPPVVRPPEEPSFLERLGDYWWALIVVGLAILAGLLLYFRKRRQPDIEDAIETLTPRDFSARRTATSAARARPDAVIVEESAATVSRATETAAARRPTVVRGAPAAAAAPAAAEVAEDTISSETAIAFDQQDALAEADFHMAYGLYDQAADLVKLAIEREPERRDLRLKLLEIYFVWGNKDMFLETARELDASRRAAEPGEWDKVLIMGKQICPDEPLFQEAVSGDGAVGVVDLNLEGGENRVDVDLFGSPADAAGEGGLDLQFDDVTSATQLRRSEDAGVDFLLDEPQRGGTDFDFAADSSARTQETPTVENPALDDDTHSQQTVELDESIEGGTHQTAELAIDDLGIDVDSFADTDDRELEGADIDEPDEEAPAIDATGAILMDEDELMSSAATAEHEQIEVDETEIDFDLDSLEEETSRSLDSTAEWQAGEVGDEASRDEFELGTDETRSGRGPSIASTRTMEAPDLSELEPVTMSEVGTKLDLARAYVDMGDPDGARSILEEVLQEGSPSQKDEAQRLLESIV